MIKYEYETGMCKQLHYNGLWSVQYEGVPGHFKKVKMVCPCIRDECDQNCEVFKNIPEIKAADHICYCAYNYRFYQYNICGR